MKSQFRFKIRVCICLCVINTPFIKSLFDFEVFFDEFSVGFIYFPDAYLWCNFVNFFIIYLFIYGKTDGFQRVEKPKGWATISCKL